MHLQKAVNYQIGYTIEIYDYTKTQISSNKFTFDYYSGILTFNEEISDVDLMSYSEIYLTGFRYIGKKASYLTDMLSGLAGELQVLSGELNDLNTAIETGLDTLSSYIKSIDEKTLTIQEQKFSTLIMTAGKPYPNTIDYPDFVPSGNFTKTYFCDYSITLTGYCWEIKEIKEVTENTDKNTSETILADIEHKFDEEIGWKSTLTIQVQVDVEETDTEPPKIINPINSDGNPVDELNFIASVFLLKDGSTIKHSILDLTKLKVN